MPWEPGEDCGGETFGEHHGGDGLIVGEEFTASEEEGAPWAQREERDDESERDDGDVDTLEGDANAEVEEEEDLDEEGEFLVEFLLGVAQYAYGCGGEVHFVEFAGDDAGIAYDDAEGEGGYGAAETGEFGEAIDDEHGEACGELGVAESLNPVYASEPQYAGEDADE